MTVVAIRDEPVVEVGVLGSFRCSVRRQPRKIPRSCQRLVAFLAVHDRPLQRGYVASNLWIDKDEGHATANLRSALWRLGQLSEPIVVADQGTLSLHPDVALDLRALSEAAYRIVDDTHGGEEGASRLAELQLFDRDLLPDWYDEWLVLDRERVRQLRLHALDRLSASLLLAGKLALAVDAACASVAAEPLRETAQRALIVAHLAAGNRVEALRQYERFRRTLDEGLGLQPSAELRSLMASAVRRSAQED